MWDVEVLVLFVLEITTVVLADVFWPTHFYEDAPGI